LKAIAEFVENSIDARAATVTITRGRVHAELYLSIKDDGDGVPRDADGRPDFKFVATHICDSIKRRLKAEGAGNGLQGEFGIGLLCFWSAWLTGKPQERLSVLPAAQEHVLALEDGKKRLLAAVTDLSKAFALSVPHEEALRIRDEVGLYQAVRAILAKGADGPARSADDLDHAIRQIVSKAIASDQIVDIFSAAGLKKPDISILSDEFLAEVEQMPQRNLAVDLLEKLLKGEIRTRAKRNVVQARSFSELLEQSVRKYQNRAIETAQVIEELIQLAKDMRAAAARGEELHLSEDELAFYEALEVNDSAVKVL
jgi:type I restriction enzyme, R subunit